MSNVADKWIQSFLNLTNQQIQAARQDKTIIAKIIAIENIDTGKYRVEYQGNTFFVFSNNLEVTYKVGEQVYVLVPQGDFSAQKLIVGRTSTTSSKDKEDALNNFYIDVSPNWLGADGWYDANRSLGICAATTAQKYSINHDKGANWFDYGFIFTNTGSDSRSRYFTHKMSSEQLRYRMKQINSFSNSCEYIRVSAEFKTEFIETHDKGTYGLQIELLTTKQETDKETKEATENDTQVNNTRTLNGQDYVLNTIELGFPTFSGAPYNYTNYTKQTAYFKLPKGSIHGLYSISLRQNGELEMDHQGTEPINSKNNVLARNIEICFAQQVNLSDSLWYAYISTPKGRSVYGEHFYGTNSSAVEAVELHPHLLYKGEDVFNTDNCEALWFRQKADITVADVKDTDKDEHNKTWFDYGGNAWYPITKLDDDRLTSAGYYGENGEWIPYYKINNGVLTIYKNAVRVKWRYKLVIIYRDNTGENYSEQVFSPEPITITRADSNYDLDLEKYTDIIAGDLSTLLRIRDYKHDPYTTNKEEMQPDGQPWHEWFGTYWLERIDGSYVRISNQFYHGPFNIDRFLTQPVTRFYVQCYDPYEIDPNNTKTAVLTGVDEVTTLVLELINTDNPEILVSWSGRDAFYYDALGTVKQWVTSRDNVLKPSIKWLNDFVSSYTMTIYAPGNTPLTTRLYAAGDESFYVEPGTENTYDCATSMMSGMYIDQDKCIHFKVDEKFDPNKTDNTFRIEILINGRTEPLVVNKEIFFIKDGDQGTIGADWSAPVFPCNYKESRDNEGLYVERLDSQQTVPLVVHMSKESGIKWEQNDNFKLYLRPFVSKNGVKIENMDPYEGYYYRCYWDVRTPESALNHLAKNASFLRLYQTTGPIFPNTGSSVKKNRNEHSPAGLVAQTSWPTDLMETRTTTSSSTLLEDYGAVEVRFFDNRFPQGNTLNTTDNTLQYEGTGASLEDMLYRFVVKCQVDVYKGQYDAKNKTISAAGDSQRVASITSFYPVDMVFTTQTKETFNTNYNNSEHSLYGFVKRMQLNWPQYVQYNATGFDPATMVDKGGLYLKIGDNDPDKLDNYLAENLTVLIQEIENKIDDEGNITQIYKPQTHLNMTEGFCGAMRTIPGEGFFGDGDKDSFFVRNQIMYLNSYGNIDINGWDGQGIDMNEEDGTIFAATLGAGFKEPNTNLFTGVIMGMDRSQKRKDVEGNGTYDADYIKSHPYMTGLFGYQDGISSFGLLENGTGFFGRADRGGRIIFDGCNATMYGGANGIMDSPEIGDPMWNTMRLSFVDLTHPTSESYTSVKGAHGEKINQGFDGAYFKASTNEDETDRNSLPFWYQQMWATAYIKPKGGLPFWYTKAQGSSVAAAYVALDPYTGTVDSNDKDKNYQLDYWNPTRGAWFVSTDQSAIQAEFEAAKAAYEKDPNGSYQDDESVAEAYRGKTKQSIYKTALNKLATATQLTGFGAARASTTPAIEIGQHVEGLMPGIIEWKEYENIFKQLRIPGNRNFMVTYDGTLWAMNGIFMGAVIGSNIIGGRIQGAEIGIGENSGENYNIKVNSGMLKTLVAPVQGSESVTEPLKRLGGGEKLGLYISPKGEVVANNIVIYGGKIDVGGLHIEENTGNLFQFGVSKFVGETNFYGGVAIVPGGSRTNKNGNAKGDLFQTAGKVALGILKSRHQDMIGQYWEGSTTYGPNYQKNCFFGIDSSDDELTPNNLTNFRGHFWPLSFHVRTDSDNDAQDGDPIDIETTHPWAQVMDNFKYLPASDNNNYISRIKGLNYFRIGEFGPESIVHYIRNSWLSESSDSDPNTDTAYLGWIGAVKAADVYSNTLAGEDLETTDLSGIGMTSFRRAPIILTTEGNMRFSIGGPTNGGQFSLISHSNITHIEAPYYAMIFNKTGISYMKFGPQTTGFGIILSDTTGAFTSPCQVYTNTAIQNAFKKGFWFENAGENSNFYLTGFKPEHQHGIYARFA